MANSAGCETWRLQRENIECRWLQEVFQFALATEEIRCAEVFQRVSRENASSFSMKTSESMLPSVLSLGEDRHLFSQLHLREGRKKKTNPPQKILQTWIRNQKINGTFIITSLETEIWVFSTKTHKNWRRQQQQHNRPVTRETPAACDLYKLLQLKRTCRNAAPFLSRTPRS